ncbi:hypothetical protein D9M68_832680 [compost metagenome]
MRDDLPSPTSANMASDSGATKVRPARTAWHAVITSRAPQDFETKALAPAPRMSCTSGAEFTIEYTTMPTSGRSRCIRSSSCSPSPASWKEKSVMTRRRSGSLKARSVALTESDSVTVKPARASSPCMASTTIG